VTSVPPSGNPPQRRQNSVLCFEPTSKLLLAYGGFKDSSTTLDDLWVFDLTEEKWKIIVPPSYTTPSESSKNGCFVDSVNKKFYMFGGGTSIGFSNEMWAFSISEYKVRPK